MPDEIAPEMRRVRSGLSLLAWILALAGCGYYALTTEPIERARATWPQPSASPASPQTLLGLTIAYWLLIAVIALVILIVAGQLGSSLGIPALFRDEPPPDPSRPGRRWNERSRGIGAAFWGGLGATLLVVQVWTVIFFSELTLHLDRFPPAYFGAGTPFRSHQDLLTFLLACCPPSLGLIALAAALPAPAPGLERRGWEFASEWARFVLGMVVGVVAAYGATTAGAYLHQYLDQRAIVPFEMPGLFNALKPFLKIQEASPVGPAPIDPVGVAPAFPAQAVADETARAAAAVTASFVIFVGVIFVFYLVLVGFFKDNLSPGMGICVLFSSWILVYSIMILLNTTGQMIFALLFVGWIVLANLDPYKYRFPGMGAYDARKVDVTALDPEELSAAGGAVPVSGAAVDAVDPQAAPPAAVAGRPAPAALLEGAPLLEKWKERTGWKKPKLVLVAVTGGAYRAAFWTTVVLDELSRCLEREGFPQQIRLMTGASGGMVGASYFAAMLRQGRRRGATTEKLREETGRDSLTPIVRRLIRRDLPKAFWPLPQRHDRGIELEEQWTTLDTEFSHPGLVDEEREGWRPSLVVSPMVIETGRRLLISNLDLADLVAVQARALPSSPGGGPKLYGRSAVQFFRVFPAAYPTFKLRTAVRMSATFPYASPAVNLPTIPPRRVVDAGYYDNYGVDLAAAWAYANQQWIRDETSGLALIEIRAYAGELDRAAQLAFLHERARDAAARCIGWLRTSVQGLTSPVEGGLSARAWTMQFHNAAAVRVLADVFNDPKQPHFFETFVFENLADFAMNWFVSDDDINRMERSIGAVRAPAAAPAGPVGTGARAVGTGARAVGARAPRAASALQRRSDEANQAEKERLIAWWGRGGD